MLSRFIWTLLVGLCACQAAVPEPEQRFGVVVDVPTDNSLLGKAYRLHKWVVAAKSPPAGLALLRAEGYEEVIQLMGSGGSEDDKLRGACAALGLRFVRVEHDPSLEVFLGKARERLAASRDTPCLVVSEYSNVMADVLLSYFVLDEGLGIEQARGLLVAIGRPKASQEVEQYIVDQQLGSE